MIPVHDTVDIESGAISLSQRTVNENPDCLKLIAHMRYMLALHAQNFRSAKRDHIFFGFLHKSLLVQCCASNPWSAVASFCWPMCSPNSYGSCTLPSHHRAPEWTCTTQSPWGRDKTSTQPLDSINDWCPRVPSSVCARFTPSPSDHLPSILRPQVGPNSPRIQECPSHLSCSARGTSSWPRSSIRRVGPLPRAFCSRDYGQGLSTIMDSGEMTIFVSVATTP